MDKFTIVKNKDTTCQRFISRFKRWGSFNQAFRNINWKRIGKNPSYREFYYQKMLKSIFVIEKGNWKNESTSFRKCEHRFVNSKRK